MRSGALVFGACVLLLAAGPAVRPAQASPRSYRIPFCIDDVRLIPAHAAKLPIPVGCALVDCCPGCPGPGPLVWHVRIAGRALEAVALEFEGLSPGAPLELEGDAKPTRGGALVGRGGAWLRNLRGDGERVPFATLRLRLADSPLPAAPDAGVAAAEPPADTIAVTIEQVLGTVVVNEFSLEYPLRPCRPKPAPACVDVVSQPTNRLGDRSVLLLDGERQGGCGDDEQYRGAGATTVASLLQPVDCPSELAVFSEGDAMWMQSPETSWTDACGDIAVAQLAAPIAAPISLWLAWPPDATGVSAAASAAAGDFANANLVYDRNKTGIQFATQPYDVSGSLRAKVAVLLGCAGAATMPAEFQTKDKLNVYYSPLPFTGENCDQDHNMVFIGTLANVATLAHELGHALSLFGEKETGGHTNDVLPFTDQNLMWGGGPATRDHVSLGQAFRFNVDERSFLNVHGVRSGTRRICKALETSEACPRLDLDWARP